jgi:four helix bundle protein
MSNVAEGLARKTDKDFAHFLDIAKGSAVETRSLLYVALDVCYIDTAAFQRLFNLASETIALIGGFSSYLRGPAPRAGRY